MATDIITALANEVSRPNAFPGATFVYGPPWTIRVDLALLNAPYTVQIITDRLYLIAINSGPGTRDPDTGNPFGSVTTQSIAQQLSDAIHQQLGQGACYVSGFETITFDPGIAHIGIGPNLSIAGFSITSSANLAWPFTLTASSALPDRTPFQGLRVAYGSNTNNSRLDRLHCWNNGRHGVYVRGADANQGSFIGVDCQNNGHGGIVDLSFLGNKWYGAHVVSQRANNSFPYATNPGNAIAEFYGCYTEGPIASWINSPSIVFGGIMLIKRGNAGAQIYSQTLGLSVRPLLREVNNSDPGDVVQFFAPDNALVGRVALAFSSSAEGAPATTLVAAIAPGDQDARPASMMPAPMAPITVGSVLTIDPGIQGSEETVVVTSVTLNTFRASFILAHNQNAVVRLNWPVPDPWRLQHGGPSGTFAKWWVLAHANTDARIALMIGDAGTPFGVGTIWFPQQRTFFGGLQQANSIEWCNGEPPPPAGHTAGDIAFNRAGNPKAFVFDGNAWQPW